MVRRREAVKQLSAICEERLPGTNFDRYFIQEFAKKFKNAEGIEAVITRLRDVRGGFDEFKFELEAVIYENGSKAEQARIQLKRDEDAKKTEEIKKGDWTMEELSMLSKGVAKYPPAVANRW